MLGSTEKKLLRIFVLATAIVFSLASMLSLLGNRYESQTLAKQNNQDLAEIGLRLIRNELRELEIIVKDYASWDDTYQYIIQPNDYFLQENFNSDALYGLEVDSVAILDLAMTIRYREGTLLGVEKVLVERHLSTLSSEMRSISQRGVLVHDNQAILFSSVPILDSFETKPANGRLVMFKRIDLNMLNNIATTIKQAFLLNAHSGVTEFLFLSTNDTWKFGQMELLAEKNQVVGTYQISQVDGNLAPFDIVVTSSLDSKGLKDTLTQQLPFILALLTLPLIMITLLRKTITEPTRELIRWLNQVDGSQLAEELKPFKHAEKGEIGELSHQFSSIYNNLYQQHQFSQILLYSISDFIFTVDHEGNIDYCNPAATEWLKVNATQLYGQSFEFLIANLSEDTPSPANWLYRAIHCASEYSGISRIRKFGDETQSEWMEIQVSPMIKSDDEPIGALVILRPKPNYSA